MLFANLSNAGDILVAFVKTDRLGGTGSMITIGSMHVSYEESGTHTNKSWVNIRRQPGRWSLARARLGPLVPEGALVLTVRFPFSLPAGGLLRDGSVDI